MSRETTAPVAVDYKRDEVPAWVREVIETGLAIEREDARSAGSLGFMTRALVSATMPSKDPKAKVFERRNGDLTLTILAPNGVPYGKYPRLLLSYLVTEAVASRSNVVVLGDTLADFLKASIGVRATGGAQGTQTRLSDQMQRLFTSIVSVGQRVMKLDEVLAVLPQGQKKRVEGGWPYPFYTVGKPIRQLASGDWMIHIFGGGKVEGRGELSLRALLDDEDLE